jgi:hypothetical protein
MYRKLRILGVSAAMAATVLIGGAPTSTASSEAPTPAPAPVEEFFGTEVRAADHCSSGLKVVDSGHWGEG